MNPYQDPVTCEVCGEPGMARAGTGYKAWFGATFRHNDPQVCADNLASQKRKLDREREEFEKEKNGSIQVPPV